MDVGEYIYCGRIELVDKPYTETQPGKDVDAQYMKMIAAKKKSGGKT